ncbi:MAG TPA: YhbY family RNA-binding protein, partial [Gammaproteobacteria bacterium]|nr:YhbY family RNA-binding protein [Gammaproteobacteria bacterium]
MALTSKQRSFLKGKAHPLHPVVQLGEAGLTEAVTAATEEALAH